MSDAWYAAFGLLAILSVANSVLLVAMMRQVGVLHQRLPPTGPGSVGPDPGASFERLDFSPVPGAEIDGLGATPVTVLAYVTPGCGLCERIPGFLEAYAKARSPQELAGVSFVLATDASESEAKEFREEHRIRLPFVCHPRVQAHYELTEVGAPYLLALADGGDNKQLLLAGGIVNTLEQLEDLVAIALQRHAYLADGDDARADESHPAVSDGNGSALRLDPTGGERHDHS